MILFQIPTTPTGWGWLLAFVTVASALIIVLSRRRTEIHQTDMANVTSLKGLLETRDLELAQLHKDLDTMTSEYKALAQVNVKEMINAWQTHLASRYYRENAEVRQECEELRVRLSKWEKV